MVRLHIGGPEEDCWFVHIEVALKRAVGSFTWSGPEEDRWFVHVDVALKRAVGSLT